MFPQHSCIIPCYRTTHLGEDIGRECIPRRGEYTLKPKPVGLYQLKEKEELTTYSDDIELVFGELPQCTKSLDELEPLTGKWLYFLRYTNRLQDVPPNMEDIAPLERAFNVARSSNLSWLRIR
jgi:hypothetical protein